VQKHTKITCKKLWKKAIQALGFLVIFLGCSAVAHAQGGITASATDSTMTVVLQGMGMLITALNFLMWILFWMLNIVTDPEFIFRPDMMEMLRQVWVFARDTVNVIFAFLLIVGALMWTVAPILYAEKMKGLIPRFVIAVVMVNFSWFIPQVILDGANILTYSIYQVPSIVSGGKECKVMNAKKELEPCKYVNDIAFLDETDKIINGATDAGGTWECQAKPLLCIQMKTMDSAFVAQNRQSVIFNGLIVNYAKLRTLVYLTDERPADPKAPLELTALLKMMVKFAVVIVIHIALFFPILAMVAAFFIRIPVIWLTMAFMPFVALGYVAGEHMGQFKEQIDKISKNFIHAAFLPAMVGVPFSIGYILLNAGMTLVAPTTGPLARRLPIFVGIDTFWQLFWLMLSLGVLWVGVFEVLKGDSVMSKFTESIKSSGEALGQFALKAPLSIPFIPAGKGGGKISPLASMEMAKPKNMLASMNASVQDQIRGAGGGGAPGANAAKTAELAKKMQADVSVKVIVDNVEKNAEFKKVLDGVAMTPQQTKDAVTAAMRDLRTGLGATANGTTENQILEAYIESQKSKLSAGQIDRLRKSI
jgi:hypothetical protein